MFSFVEKPDDIRKKILNFLLEEANDTEKEAADILFGLTIENNPPEIPVSHWGSKRRRNTGEITAPPHESGPTAMVVANDVGDSRFEIRSGSENIINEKLATHEENIPFKIKDEEEASGLEPPKGKVKRLIIKPPKPENSLQIGNGDESFSFKDDVCLFLEHKKEKKTSHKTAKSKFKKERAELAAQPEEDRLVGESRTIKEEETVVLESNSLVPQEEAAKGKSQLEMENKMQYWEMIKAQLLESIEKVEPYLEKKKALNLQLKAHKLQLQAKSDAACR